MSKGGRKKNGLFTVRLTIRGRGGAAPSALTVRIFEHFDPSKRAFGPQNIPKKFTKS